MAMTDLESPMSFMLKDVVFRHSRQKTPALNGLSAIIPRNCTTAVLGPSGSGKTTLLNLLGLLLYPTLANGTIAYRADEQAGDLEYQHLLPSRGAQLRQREFGFVFQSCFMLPHFSCAQNIGMPLALAGASRAERAKQVAQLIAQVKDEQLARDLDHLPPEVAGGQKQRAAVLRAIIHDPKVVFADEPISNLDSVNAGRVEDLLRRWQAGEMQIQANSRPSPRTLILVTHDINFAWRMADHFLLLPGNRYLQKDPTLTKQVLEKQMQECAQQ
jgi:ABC-type lipoprotein export system ATPase subunit